MHSKCCSFSILIVMCRFQPEGFCTDLRKFIDGPSSYLTLPDELKSAIEAITYIAEALQSEKDYEAVRLFVDFLTYSLIHFLTKPFRSHSYPCVFCPLYLPLLITPPSLCPFFLPLPCHLFHFLYLIYPSICHLLSSSSSFCLYTSSS